MDSCIYQIKNLVNNKTYIGQTVNFNKRKIRHIWALKTNRHDNYHLQNSYNIYGIDNFEFSKIVNCKKDELTKLEQYLVDFYKPEYNICKEIVETCKGVTRSQTTKDKISKSHKNKILSKEHKKLLSFAHKGLKQSLETIEKRMLKLRGRKLSEEQLIKRKTLQISCKEVLKICMKTQHVVDEYKSITEAAKLNNIHVEAIGNCVRGKTLSSGGFRWTFKNKI